MAIHRGIHGMDGLLRRLARLADEKIQEIGAEAAHAAAEPVLAAARENAPVLAESLPGHAPPGTLRDSLEIKDRRGKTKVSSSVGTRSGNYQGDEFYGAFVELGHKQGKRPGAGDTDARAEIAPEPYLEPAFDANVDRSLDIFRDRLASGIARAAQE